MYWVGEPCQKARYDICKAAFKRKKVDVAEELLNELSASTMYFSGADLMWLCNEAMIESEHHGYKIESSDFKRGIFELIEENKNRVMTLKTHYDPLRAWAMAYCKPAGLPAEK